MDRYKADILLILFKVLLLLVFATSSGHFVYQSF